MATIDTPLPPRPAALGPVREPDRIAAMDVARGFALLGILLVNMQFFAGPFGEAIVPLPPEGAGAAEVLAFYFVSIFCGGKFYPLFSLLFGMGLVLQLRRSDAAARPFAPLYLRRLAALALIGLAHAIFLWYGDILFMYSLVGVVLLLCARAKPRSLLIAAVSVLLLYTVISAGMATFWGDPAALKGPPAAAAPAGPTGEPAPVEGDPPAPAASPDEGVQPDRPPPLERLAGLFEDPQGSQMLFNSPVWLDAETEAFRDGDYWQATGFRLINYGFMLIFSLFGFVWSILGMFLLGAALMKWNIFAPERLHWHRRFALAGLLIGLPLSAAASLLPAFSGISSGTMALMGLFVGIGAPLMSMGYLGAWTLLTASGRAAALTGLLGRAGRMALTVYLLETVTATFLMYHWGLGLFGTTGRVERIGLALAIYAALLTLSALWMRFFRMGPAEWVWRTLTYFKPQPIARKS